MAANKLKSEYGFYANNKSVFKNGVDIDGTVNLSSISTGTIATGGKYLILDNSNNVVYQNTAATISDIGEFTGADGTNAGSSGLVPQPAADENNKYLKGDGTWSTLEDTSFINAIIFG